MHITTREARKCGAGRLLLQAAEPTLRQAGVTVAVTWHFTKQMIQEVMPTGSFPRLAAFSAAAEALPVFKAAPHGDGTFHAVVI